MTGGSSPLSGKVALVTGAGSGIGKAIALRLAASGADMAVADISAASATGTSEEIRSRGTQAEAISADLGDIAAAQGLISSAVARFGRLDILVNNAGIGAATKFLEQPLDELQRIFAVNFVGSYACSQRAAAQMIDQGSGGRIIHIASVNGSRANPGRTAYGSSKAALLGLTLHMAAELGPSGITVNAVSPGLIETAMSASMQSDVTRQRYLDTVPARRGGSPEEVAGLVAFLASDAGAYVTGQDLRIDGGYTA